VNETLTLDAINAGRQYYQLTPSAPRTLFNRDLHSPDWSTALHYDPASFPSWRGTSATFMAWVQVGQSGYILSKHPNYGEPAHCWSFRLEFNGISTFGGAQLDGFITPQRTIRLPGNKPLFHHMSGFRHVAMVFDAVNDILRGYIDGVLIGQVAFEPGEVGQLDCANGPRTYYGLGHRAPGSGPFLGEIADMRMYVGQALTGSEIQSIENAGDETVRSCLSQSEAARTSDSATFQDEYSRNCEWYRAMRMYIPGICAATTVQAECPNACGMISTCLNSNRQDNRPDIYDAYQLYPKVEKMVSQVGLVTNESPADRSNHPLWEVGYGLRGKRGVLCARNGLDLAQQCRGWVANGRTPWQPTFYEWPTFGDYITHMNDGTLSGLLDVEDCELIERISDPFCSFTAHHPPKRSRNEMNVGQSGAHFNGVDMDRVVNASGGYSIVFWIKNVHRDSMDATSPAVVFYSNVAPAVPLVNVRLGDSGIVLAEFFGRCGANEHESTQVSLADVVDNSHNGLAFLDEWTHISVSFRSATADAGGQVKLEVNGVVGSKVVSWREWCPSPHGGFVDAVSFSNAVYVSNIAVLLGSDAGTKASNQYRSTELDAMRRTGPRRSNSERHASLIGYNQVPYSAPGHLITPALVRVRQVSHTPTCAAASFGEVANQHMIANANRTRCSYPFTCDGDENGFGHMVPHCLHPARPSTHFGRVPFPVHQELFTEFLASLCDAPTLIRKDSVSGDRVVHDTSAFFGRDTREVTVEMVALSMQYGVASRITVHGEIGSLVTMSASVQHYTVVHAQRSMMELGVLMACGLIVVLLSIADIWVRVDRFNHTSASRSGIMLDLALLVIMPLIYLSMCLDGGLFTDDRATELVSQLLEVPWANTSVPWGDKLNTFFHGLNLFDVYESHAVRQDNVGYYTCIALLLRSVAASGAHPRIGVLVKTVYYSIDDIAHLAVLVVMVFGGFLVLAVGNFGGEDGTFSTWEAAIDTQWEMFVAGAREGVQVTGSSSRVTFMLLFSLTIFFLAFNVIIAIIVESYLKVKKEVEDLKADSNVVFDVFESIRVLILEHVHSWPNKRNLRKVLRRSALNHVSPSDVHAMLPAFHYSTIRSVFEYYNTSRFPFLHPDGNRYEPKEFTLSRAVNELERRIALMLNTVPTNALSRVSAEQEFRPTQEGAKTPKKLQKRIAERNAKKNAKWPTDINGHVIIE